MRRPTVSRTDSGIAADRWVEHLERHIPVAREGLDPEGAHQMRVAIARLRVWLALGRWRVLDDDLRWLRARIAQVRDLDVQLEHDPPRGWAKVLRRRHELAHRELVATLGHGRLASLLAALSCMPEAPTRRAGAMVPKLARRALRRARGAHRRGTDLAALHRLRREIRRLRFALEWLGVDADDLVEVQDALGKACDYSVALADLRRARDRGPGAYRADLRRRLRRAESDARDALDKVRPRLKELATCKFSSFATPRPSRARRAHPTRSGR